MRGRPAARRPVPGRGPAAAGAAGIAAPFSRAGAGARDFARRPGACAGRAAPAPRGAKCPPRGLRARPIPPRSRARKAAAGAPRRGRAGPRAACARPEGPAGPPEAGSRKSGARRRGALSRIRARRGLLAARRRATGIGARRGRFCRLRLNRPRRAAAARPCRPAPVCRIPNPAESGRTAPIAAASVRSCARPRRGALQGTGSRPLRRKPLLFDAAASGREAHDAGRGH